MGTYESRLLSFGCRRRGMAFLAFIKRRSAIKPYGTLGKGIQLIRRLSNSLEADQPAEDEVFLRYHAPTSLAELIATTHFSKEELKLLYRSFKNAFPLGRVLVEDLATSLSVVFQKGDTTDYAQILFNKFDTSASGCVTFCEFVRCLSVVNRGSVQEKLEWIFDLYDTDQDEVLDFAEMRKIIISIYKLSDEKFGRRGSNDSTDDPWIRELKKDIISRGVNIFMQKFDLKNQGFVQKDDFVKAGLKDDLIVTNLAIFAVPLFSIQPIPPPPCG